MAEEKRVKGYRATVSARYGEPETYDWLEVDGTLIRVDCITAVVPTDSAVTIYADVAAGPFVFERAEVEPSHLMRDVRRALGIVV